MKVKWVYQYHTKWTSEQKKLSEIKRKSVHQEDITTLNMYALNNRASEYMYQKLTKLKSKINPQLQLKICVHLSQYPTEVTAENKQDHRTEQYHQLDLTDIKGTLAPSNRIQISSQAHVAHSQMKPYAGP